MSRAFLACGLAAVLLAPSAIALAQPAAPDTSAVSAIRSEARNLAPLVRSPPGSSRAGTG